MPSRHVIRQFYDGGHYHVYNRGVAKQDIFDSPLDYAVFLYYLKVYLSPRHLLDTKEKFYNPQRRTYYGKVELLSYCLMPNHFHLFVKQLQSDGISEMLRSLTNAYTRYYNNSNDRVGHLLQGRFKAAIVDSDQYYMHLSRYIHQNPLDLGSDLESYEYSSCRYFTNNRASFPVWLRGQQLLDIFGSKQAYRSFLHQPRIHSKQYLDDAAIDE